MQRHAILLALTLGACTTSQSSENSENRSLTCLALPSLAFAPIPDGVISRLEWSGAREIDLGEGVVLLFGAFEDQVFLAARSAPRGPHYVDVFISDGSEAILNLHASMRLGARFIDVPHWSDATPAMRWGAPQGWTANTARLALGATASETRFVPFDGMEFAIERDLVVGGETRIRVEARDFFGV